MGSVKDFKKIAKEVIAKEAKALKKLESFIDENFNKAIEIIYNCKGKVIISGVGKSGHIGSKIAATLSSTGTPAFFLNPMEGIHGDIGVVMKEDIIIAISKSGETEELLNLLTYPKRIGIKIIAITAGKNSTLSNLADVTLLLPDVEEVCPMNLAPTTSTTLTLVVGDAIAVALMLRRNFKKEEFAIFHPGGSIGRKLKRIYELMTPVSEFAIAHENVTVREALKKIIEKNKGLCVFIDDRMNIKGILTDGDLKRLLLKVDDLLDKKASQVMIKNPVTINKDAFVVEALKIMENKYHQLLVLDEKGKLCGVIHIHDILKGKVL